MILNHKEYKQKFKSGKNLSEGHRIDGRNRWKTLILDKKQEKTSFLNHVLCSQTAWLQIPTLLFIRPVTSGKYGNLNSLYSTIQVLKKRLFL